MMRLNISLLAPGNACVRYGGSDTTHRLFTVSAGTPSGCTAPQGYLAGRQRPPVRSRREVIAERISACQALEHPTEGTKASPPPVQPDENRKAVVSLSEGNAEVHISNGGKYPSLTISSLETLDELLSLLLLNSRVRQLLPLADLTELLLETGA